MIAVVGASESGVSQPTVHSGGDECESEIVGATFTLDLAEERLSVATTDAAKTAVLRSVEGERAWLAAFWFGAQQRKHGVRFEIVEGRSGVRVTGEALESAARFEEHWTKQIRSALKKVEVEDLGAMDSQRLWEAIPDEDSAGRGKKDLAAIEKDLSLKVVFCVDGHVLLVGAKAKLQKKAFTLRNLLSHYHWRLSGRDVAFEMMPQKRQ